MLHFNNEETLDLFQPITRSECNKRILTYIDNILGGAISEIELAELSRYLVIWSHVVMAISRYEVQVTYDKALTAFTYWFAGLSAGDVAELDLDILKSLKKIVINTQLPESHRFTEEMFSKIVIAAGEAIERELTGEVKGE